MGDDMKKIACITLACSALLLTDALSVLAGEPYYPYQSYDDYYKTHSVEPHPSQKPAPSPPAPEGQVKPPPRAEQPITLTQPPEFLFPQELGFGVAVGVPYDMFYLSGGYYFLRSGSWYRSSSYRGPWTVLGLSQLPPEFRKHKLAKIREFRNREFNNFWKNKDHYQGRYFRPGSELKEPSDKKPRNKVR
jgi:hypothetical protein